MKTKNMVKVGVIGLLTLLLVVLPLVTACAEEAPPTVTKPALVKVAYLADLTGPYASVGAPLLAGFTDYMEMTNEKGGIDGVPIQVLWADTKADAALSTAAYKRFKTEGILCLSCMVTPVALAVKTLVNEDKIPGINQTATLSIYVPPTDYMWCHGGVATDYDLACLYWFDTQLWDKAKWGQWTLGILAHDNAFAKGGIAAMYKFADTYNVKLLQPEIVAVGTLDFSTNIKRLVDAGADVIFCETLGAASGTVLKQMGELGVLGTIEEAATTPGKVVPYFGYTSYYVSNLQAALDYAHYTYGARGYAASWEEELPGVKECNDFMIAKYGAVLDPLKGGTDYREGWHNALTMVAAIKRAQAAVGWENLNGQTLMESGLTGLVLDTQGFSGATGYNDYEGDRINIQSFRPAAWDAEKNDIAAIGPYINVPELMRDLEVTSYRPAAAGEGWYIP